MYFEYYIMGIILLPGIIFASWAQAKVNSTYKKYGEYFTSSGLTAAELIKRLLGAANMDLQVMQVHGHLTDHFDPKNNRICLSDSVYSSTSVAALGVACHEFGHALQRKERYAPYQLRRILIPLTNFASNLLWPLVIIGLIFNFAAMPGTIVGDIFLWSGIIVFGLAALFDFITLPCEYNASNRALQILEQSEILTPEETNGASQVLRAAALTYVASLLTSILNLVRFILVFLMHTKED